MQKHKDVSPIFSKNKTARFLKVEEYKRLFLFCFHIKFWLFKGMRK